MNAAHFDLAVVGASVAGEALVSRLRDEGYGGRILVIDRDPRMPYERPPLSKRYLADSDPAEISVEWDAGLEVTVAEAVSVDPEARELRVRFSGEADERALNYQRLVIATGAAPVRLPIEPDGVLRLRTAADADRIRAAATVPGTRVGIIGAGAIGVELATSLRALGCEVTVLDKADRPLERLLAGHLGGEVTGWLEGMGIECRWGVDIAEIAGDPGDWRVRLGSGESVPFDLLIGAVGARPTVEWLESSGLLSEGRLLCDTDGRVLGPQGPREHEFAIGDVVTRRFADGSLTRTESWTAAAEQGAQLADRLLGREPDDPEIPYFWTEVADRRVQVLGALRPGGELEIEFQNQTRGQVLYRVGEGEAADGWIGVNTPGQIAQRRMAAVI